MSARTYSAWPTSHVLHRGRPRASCPCWPMRGYTSPANRALPGCCVQKAKTHTEGVPRRPRRCDHPPRTLQAGRVRLYSRKIVGWEVHDSDHSDHAAHLVRRTALAECIAALADKPVLHGDNGSTLKATTVLAMLNWLGVKPSYSRPRVTAASST